jgi:hypothetical protein
MLHNEDDPHFIKVHTLQHSETNRFGAPLTTTLKVALSRVFVEAFHFQSITGFFPPKPSLLLF